MSSTEAGEPAVIRAAAREIARSVREDLPISAAVLRGYDAEFSIETLRLDTRLAPDEILVRIAGCGLCHTDLAVRGSAGRSPLPAVLGHEGSGTVVDAGDAVAHVSDLEVGDHVVLSFDSCGRCPSCLRGAPSYCESFATLNLFGGRTDDRTRFTDERGEVLAPRWFGQSSFAQYAVTRARNAVNVDPTLPLELLGPLGCGFLTGAGAVFESLRPRPGETLAVFGAGAVGLAAVLAAAASGVAVVAVDRRPERLRLAEQFGAVTVGPEAPDPAAAIIDHTGGVHYALDTTGAPELINAALRTLRPTGTLGVVARQRGELVLQPGGLDRGRRLMHICEGDAVPGLLIPRLIGLWQAGSFPFDRLVRTYPLRRLAEAERDFLAGRVVKPVLLPDRPPSIASAF